MPQIFRGQVPKLPMLCSSEKWRGAQCVGQIPVASTESEGLMPKTTPLASKIGLKKIRMAKNHGIANCIRLVSVSFIGTTNMLEKYTNTSVLFV